MNCSFMASHRSRPSPGPRAACLAAVRIRCRNTFACTGSSSASSANASKGSNGDGVSGTIASCSGKAGSRRILVTPRLDDRAGGGIPSRRQIRQADTMRTAVNAADDGKSRAFQLIIQPARGQTANHGRGFRLTPQYEISGSPLPSFPGEALMNALDDVVRSPGSRSTTSAFMWRPCQTGSGRPR